MPNHCPTEKKRERPREIKVKVHCHRGTLLVLTYSPVNKRACGGREKICETPFARKARASTCPRLLKYKGVLPKISFKRRPKFTTLPTVNADAARVQQPIGSVIEQLLRTNSYRINERSSSCREIVYIYIYLILLRATRGKNISLHCDEILILQ